MQDCIRKVDTKAVMTVRMKLPSFSAGMFLKNFINNYFFKILFFAQGFALLFSYFLRREERSKEASTPSKPPPILGGLTREIAETDDFPPFWYRGTRDVFLTAGAREKDEKRTRDGLLYPAC